MASGDVSQLELRAADNGVELTLKVVPGASRSALAGVWGHALKVAVCAPPEGGRANEEVRRVLAAALGVRASHIVLRQGQTRPVKRVLVRGMTVSAVRTALAAALSQRA
jgi:uncharacterized protein (TIGR00251 family)